MPRASSGRPRVSVIMPVHDGEQWLASAVASVLAQTESDLELLVIDDGSGDGSPALLASLAAGDQRVRVLRQPHRGLAAALNLGLAEARAPLAARLDCDDLAHPDRIERQADWLEAHPAAGLVGAWAIEIDARDKPVGMRTPPCDSVSLNRLLRRANPFVHSAIMARARLLKDAGGYRTALEGAEDYDLWLRIAEVAEVANLPRALVSYRVHPGGVSARGGLRQAFSARLAQRAAEARRRRLGDPADRLEDPPDWRAVMPTGTFYAEDAALYRWLDPAAHAPADEGRGMLIERLPHLSHAERRLAAHALLSRMRSADRSESGPARSLLLRLCRERPSTVLRAAWSLRT